MGFNLSECSSYLPTQRPANEMNRTAVVSHSLSREEISFPEKLFGCISQAKNATRQIATRRVANVHLIDRQCDKIVMIFLRDSLPTKEVQLNGIFLYHPWDHGPSSASFYFYVYCRVFKQTLQFLKQIYVKKCPSCIWGWYMKPQP